MTAAATAAGLDAGAAGRPPAGSLRWHWSLTRELAYTQFKLKYTGSILGYLWSLVNPLMLFGILYLVFVHVLKIGGASPNFPLQLLVAVFIYTYFSEATSVAVSSVAGSGHLIRKAYFPRAILVVAASMTATMTFLINLALVIVIAAPLHLITLGARSLAAPLYLVELYLLVLGLSLLLSALFVFYRDIGHIWAIILQVLFYGSAVLYPFDLIPGKILPTIIAVNPIAQVIEDMRHVVVTPAAPWVMTRTGWALYWVPFAIVASTLALGAWVFRRMSPRFAESL